MGALYVFIVILNFLLLHLLKACINEFENVLKLIRVCEIYNNHNRVLFSFKILQKSGSVLMDNHRDKKEKTNTLFITKSASSVELSMCGRASTAGECTIASE